MLTHTHLACRGGQENIETLGELGGVADSPKERALEIGQQQLGVRQQLHSKSNEVERLISESTISL
jgi:hypothetical protein